jgi:hypothetical protein
VSTVAAIGAVEEAIAVAEGIGAAAVAIAERIRGDGAERRVSLIVAPSTPAL